jgi:hypothetical protein
MTSPTALHPPDPPGHPATATPPTALHERAEDNLAYIRRTMARAGSFTAVPGWGGVGMGLVGLAAALVASRQPDMGRWLAVWVMAAVLGVTTGAVAVVFKARAASVPLVTGPGRKFALDRKSVV